MHVQPVNARPDGTSRPERVAEAVADTARVLIDAASSAGDGADSRQVRQLVMVKVAAGRWMR